MAQNLNRLGLWCDNPEVGAWKHRDDPDATLGADFADGPSDHRPLPPLSEHVESGEVLGAGGMGVVRGGTQHAPHRQVAVKHLRPDGAASERRALEREAAVLGALEHPGIVPVHLVAQDQDGRPAVVMKRIEGTLWADAVTREAAEPELVERLDVLLAVCNAVEYAHQRGILHLDIKPDNVMIGAFGEVYLLDWGLARRVSGDVPAPWASEINEPMGTPAFMAPELAEGAGSRVGVQTDVYLLGGCLAACIRGQGPRESSGPLRSQLLDAAMGGIAEWPPDAPRGLVHIALRALAVEPGDRHPSVAALREDVQRWLHTRHVHRLLERAERAGDELRIALAADDHRAVMDAFAEGRIALRLAEEQGAAAADAEPIRTYLWSRMIRWHLHRQELESAEALLDGLPSDDSGLRDELQRARARMFADSEEISALRELAQNVDPARGAAQRQRALMHMVVNAALFVGLGFAMRAGWFDFSYTLVFSLLAISTPVNLAAGLYVRRRAADTEVNRVFVDGSWAIGAGCLLLAGVGWMIQLAPLNLIPLVCLLIAAAGVPTARTLRISVLVPVVQWVPAAFISAAWPSYSLDVFGVACMAQAIGLHGALSAKIRH